MVEETVVKTGVDELIDLVHKEKSISVEQVAKKLGQPERVVEQWANFLEEENLIKMKFSGITPYLEPIDSGKTTGAPISTKAVESGLKEPPTPPKIVIPPPTVKPKPLSAPPPPKQKIPSAPPPAKHKTQVPPPPPGKSVLHNAGIKPTEHPKTINLPTKVTPKPHVTIKRTITKPKQKIAPGTEFNHAEQLVKEAKTLLKEKKLHEAIEKSLEAETLFRKIPPDETNKRILLEEELMSLQAEVLTLRYKEMKLQHDKIVNEIKHGVQKIKFLVPKGRTAEAEVVYRDITQTKKKLPDGFCEEDAEIEKELVLLHEEMMHATIYRQTKLVEQKSREVLSSLSQCKQLLHKGDLGSANAAYHKAVRAYGEIPDGFLEKKVHIYKTMMPVLKEVLDSWLTKTKTKKQTNVNELKKLLTHARSQLLRRDPQGAKLTYKLMAKKYALLPEGFMNEKTKLRLEMIKLYKQIMVAQHGKGL